jgi:hypothetical protein
VCEHGVKKGHADHFCQATPSYCAPESSHSPLAETFLQKGVHMQSFVRRSLLSATLSTKKLIGESGRTGAAVLLLLKDGKLISCREAAGCGALSCYAKPFDRRYAYCRIGHMTSLRGAGGAVPKGLAQEYLGGKGAFGQFDSCLF